MAPSLSLVAGIYSPVEKNRGGVNSTKRSDFSDGCGTMVWICGERFQNSHHMHTPTMAQRRSSTPLIPHTPRWLSRSVVNHSQLAMSQMQTIVAHELFAPRYGEDVAVARLGLIGYLTMFLQIVAYFYKTMSDRYGRSLMCCFCTS